MRILITGAGGFLGFEIAKLLVQKKYEVYNFSRYAHKKLDNIGVKTISGDLTKAEDIKALFSHGFDAVFHVAALAGVWGKKEDFFAINYEGTKTLVDCAISSGVKTFIYTSTPSVVFGSHSLEGVDELTPYPDHFLTHYAHSKRLAEEYVLSKNTKQFQVCALRPHLIWGPNDPHILPRLIKRRKQNRLKIIGDGKNLVDVIHVNNAAYAHVLAFENFNEKMNGQAYFIGQEKPVNLWQFINKMLLATGNLEVKGRISFQVAYTLGSLFETLFKVMKIYSSEPPMTRFVALQLATSHYFSHQKAHDHFGYAPRITIEEGLKTLER
jgi:nucleoside-diphosphate-sugar epimerase